MLLWLGACLLNILKIGFLLVIVTCILKLSLLGFFGIVILFIITLISPLAIPITLDHLSPQKR